MPTFDYDFRYIRAALDQLESYLLTKDIYRPIGVTPPPGESPYPQLTLGTLLLAKERARASAQTSNQRADLDRLIRELESIRAKWRSAWGRKASAEFRARLNLWGDFLNDYRQHPDSNEDRYAYEISRRVMLHLLLSDTLDLPAADQELLTSLDLLLETVLIPGKFIWDEILQTAFPRRTYWYLYGYLPKTPAQN